MSYDQTRRNFVGVAGIAAATVATTALLRPASAQTATAVPKMEYAIKKLPFDPAKIKGTLGEAARQPLRQQLQRRGQAAERHHRPAGRRSTSPRRRSSS